MVDKNQIETLLRIHGMSPTSPEEEIRSVLLSAQYNTDEIDTAMTVLRENIYNKTSRLEGLHKIYRTDSGLQPKEVSSLLGIDMDIQEVEMRNHRTRKLTGGQNFIVLAVALLLALFGLMYSMYLHQTGPFHPSFAFSEE